MRTWIARGVTPVLLWLLCLGATPPQLRPPSLKPPPYLLVRTFSTTAVKPPNSLGLKGVIEDYCGGTFGTGTVFEITYNGQPFDISVAGLSNGQKMSFDVTAQVTSAPQTPASFTFAIILPDRLGDHNVSPCDVSFVVLP